MTGLGCSRFARHYSGNRIRFLLLRLLRCFSSAAYLYPGYIFTRELRGITHAGLPHSGISGSSPASGFPKLFVACYALLRLQVPRHPPCALSNLTTQSESSSETKLKRNSTKLVSLSLYAVVKVLNSTSSKNYKLFLLDS